MADKDIFERDVIKDSIPDAAVLICLFHTLQSLRQEITCEKLGITAGQRSATMQKLAYASSEAKYSQLYEDFQRDAPRR